MHSLTNTTDSLITLGQRFHKQGWVPATSGNFSVRLDNGDIAITRSGRHKGNLNQEDFIHLDGIGNTLDEGVPSAETELHLALYRSFAGIGCVLHTHSPNAAIISNRAKGAIEISGYELLKAFDGITTHETCITIPVFDNDQNIPRLSGQVNEWLGHESTPIAYLIRAHGLYIWGKDVASAERHIEAIEYLFSCELYASHSP
ncbi:methylthioribulose 1-phosphate dehydratase [Acidihalobacter prosperus]